MGGERRLQALGPGMLGCSPGRSWSPKWGGALLLLSVTLPTGSSNASWVPDDPTSHHSLGT